MNQILPPITISFFFFFSAPQSAQSSPKPSSSTYSTSKSELRFRREKWKLGKECSEAETLSLTAPTSILSLRLLLDLPPRNASLLSPRHSPIVIEIAVMLPALPLFFHLLFFALSPLNSPSIPDNCAALNVPPPARFSSRGGFRSDSKIWGRFSWCVCMLNCSDNM